MTKSTMMKCGKILSVFALATVMGISAPTLAKADWHDHRGPPPRGWHGHDWHDTAYWRVHHYYPQPGYVYAPPAVVMAPPPPSPGINLILPMHFN